MFPLTSGLSVSSSYKCVYFFLEPVCLYTAGVKTWLRKYVNLFKLKPPNHNFFVIMYYLNEQYLTDPSNFKKL